ncbi:ribosomal RNA small subunit methyltransferase E [Anaplasma platys]|uniref:Ribosomal RNA small subunit methyltransferase E n=1 Tax=Anaplasma platys TaxID=949 RepID=A0A858PYG0_9RICK|nr:16S rRNA (uracil(1498)-N(3))-methyltransferase [Anaplasma platys]QJC27646.1 ribosomal RNA small subunit methyltransferase E [Anaplasma platys]
MFQKKKQVKIRLHYNEMSLKEGCSLTLKGDQAHYVRDVMRAKPSDAVMLFDGTYGDWTCIIEEISRSGVLLRVEALSGEYMKTPDLTLCISLIKPDTMRSVVRQATEMGVTVIQPVLTEYSSVRNINIQKCWKWAVEAAEQCCRQDVPVIKETMGFYDLRDLESQLILCDETGKGEAPARVLCGVENLGIVIGPEGGFSEKELLYSEAFAGKMSLGSRVLRVDTAVVAALSYVNEHCLS